MEPIKVTETDPSAETLEVMRTKKRREGGTHSDACLNARVQSVCFQVLSL